MTLGTLLTIAAALLPAHADAARARAGEAAADLLLVESDEALVRVAFVWSYFEAGWQADPRGSNDHGSSCGTMQVSVAQWADVLPESWTCAAMRADRVLGFRAGFLVLHHLRGVCGALDGALRAYATGSCSRGADLVARRCLRAGLTSTCEVKR